MAKGKKGRNRTRESSGFASSQLRSFVVQTPRLVEDQRTFDFEPGTRPARLFHGGHASVTASPITKKSSRAEARVPYQIAFSAPADTLVCVRRHRRREVLHAFKKTGKRGQRRSRRNKWSDVKC